MKAAAIAKSSTQLEHNDAMDGWSEYRSGIVQERETRHVRPPGSPGVVTLARRAAAGMVLAFAALLATSAPTQAQTAVLVSNVGQSSSGGLGFDEADGAQAFTTGDHSNGYTVTSVWLDLTSSENPTFDFTVGIWTNSNFNLPGSSLGTLTAPDSWTVPGVNEFTTSGIKLAANTTYWVVADSNGSDIAMVVYWESTASEAEDSTSASGWSIADESYEKPYADGNWRRYSDSFKLRVDVTASGVLNNVPVIATTSPLSVVENTTAVATLAATDADSGDTLTWSKHGGADASYFNLTPAGVLTFDFARNFEFRTDTDRDNGYEVTVRVSDGTAPADLALTVNVTDVDEQPDTPAVPSVSATADSTTSLDVSWMAPGLNGGPALTGYDLQYRAGTSGPFTDGPQDVTGLSTAITGLTAGTAYQVQVRALNGETPSDWSPAGTGSTSTPANAAPVITTTSPQSAAENTTAVVTLAATDTDSGDTLTWSKNGGADASAFTLTTAGVLTFASAPNYEDPTDTGTDNGYEVTVRVSDGTAPADLALTVNVTDVDEQPDTPAVPSVSATADSTTSLDVSWMAPGLNGGPALTGYDLQYRAGTSGPFTDGPQDVTGLSTAITGLTAGTAYQVQVRALNGETPSDWSPAGTGSTSTPANAAPVITTTSPQSAAENTTAVVTLAATDTDSGDTLTWSKNGGADASAFTLTTAGVLTFASAPNYEDPTDTGTDNGYEVTVRVSDGTAPADLALTVNVTDVDEQPDTPAVPSVSATADSTTSLDVSWMAPGLNGGPALTGYDLQYRAGTSGPFTDGPQDVTGLSTAITGLTAGTAYQVQVRALNGETPSDWSPAGTGSTSTPANAAPVITTTSPQSAAENTTAVVTLAATDTDSGDTLTWSKNGGADASAFTLTTAGVLTFASAPNYEDPTDTGTDNGYEVTVRVSDGTAPADLALTVNVTDVDEQPDTPAVPSVSATADSTTSLDVSWMAPGLNGGPALTGYDLQYRAGTSGPFTDGPQDVTGLSTAITGLTAGTAYQVQVRALNGETPSDWSPAGTGSTSTPPNNAPTFTEGTNTTRSVDEDTASGQNIGEPITATDADTGDTLIYALGGTDAAAFGIVSTSGQLQTSAALDYATKSSYAVTVTVSDGKGGSDSINVTINVTVDRAALVALYNATGGATWTNNRNWLTNEALSEWHRVTTDENGRVTILRLVLNGLSGEIPPELGNLANLQILSFSRNGLSGEIPAALGNLANLQTLSLSANTLTGEIPVELGDLANLERLDLLQNALSGEIPAELGGLANLELLYLHRNELSGSIPAELGDLANLRYLYLNDNTLSGSIPVSLGDLANLRYLYLDENALSGSIPASLGDLVNLQYLYLNDNELSGSIPPELESLTQLQVFDIRNTGLCVTAGSELQTWLATINFQGSVCAAHRRPPLLGT